MMITIQNRIMLNAFSSEATKTKYKVIISKWVCSQTFSNFDAMIQILILLTKGDSIFPLRTLLFYPRLLNVYAVFFCLQLETNLSVFGLEAQKTFFVIQVFLFLFYHWVKLKIFFNFLLFSRPYKLCAKRETKAGMVLSGKIT